ncbi:MAG: SDR family oxidoreductase [Proteobacteria bacterium]|nr:SDR family oxidoreductase [Pseudomonadota bacterium]
MDYQGKTAAITGAGSGIGRALSLSLARKGCNLALSDISEERLDETKALIADQNVGCSLTVLDVSDRDAVESWAQDAVSEFGTVDFVFNNAGVTVVNSADDLSYEDFHWIMNINFWGVVHGSKAFLPHFLERGEGAIINVSSLFGLISVPSQSSYNASKFAVRGFTESLAQEVSKKGITVCSVHPGGIKTSIARNARFNSPGFGAKNMEEFTRAFEKGARTTSEEAANVILSGVEKGRKRILIGGDAKLLDIIQRLTPTRYNDFINLLYRLNRKKS